MKSLNIKNLSILCLISFQAFGQSFSPEVTQYVDGSQMLDLKKTRLLCNNLIDSDVTHAGKYLYPKRKNAYKRNIKQLCEKLELKVWLEEPISAKDLNSIYELNLMQASMAKKAQEDAQGMTLIDKIKMGLTSVISPFILKKRIQITEDIIKDPKDSIFWKSADPEIALHKRFKALAKKKKIKPSENQILIFDGVSDGGSAPKVKTLDTNLDDAWSLKWGDEIHTDAVGSRIFAALGFDVDHPYYRGKNEITLVFPKSSTGVATNSTEMINKIKQQFKIDVSAFISNSGVIGDIEIREDKKLKKFKGLSFVRFVECAIEGRPDRVKRLGPIMSSKLGNQNRMELRGAMLAHLWIDNWDTRAENTLLTNNHLGKRKYKISGAFSDLGTSFGVKVKNIPVDFRVGLVNEFGWDIIKKKTKRKIKFIGQLNSMLGPYKKATYRDFKWMAQNIAKISEKTLEKILDNSGWPKGLKKLYFHKLASRRAQILEAFEVVDPNPIEFDRKFSYAKDGVTYIKNGVLIKDYSREEHPIGYLNTMGRLRNYGGAKL